MTLLTIKPDLLRDHPRVVPLTSEQYQQMVESGIIPSGAPIELIDGLLVPKNRSAAGEDPMSIGKRHVLSVNMLMMLNRLLPAGFFIQIQQPVEFPPDSEPEPDGSLLRGKPEDYADRLAQPNDAIAIFEVADSSLQQDRSTKLRVYADAGVQQYFIVNLIENVVEEYRRPLVGEGRYAEPARIAADGNLVIMLAPDQPFTIRASSLLPPSPK
jgi:hypothetical protein